MTPICFPSNPRHSRSASEAAPTIPSHPEARSLFPLLSQNVHRGLPYKLWFLLRLKTGEYPLPLRHFSNRDFQLARQRGEYRHLQWGELRQRHRVAIAECPLRRRRQSNDEPTQGKNGGLAGLRPHSLTIHAACCTLNTDSIVGHQSLSEREPNPLIQGQYQPIILT